MIRSTNASPAPDSISLVSGLGFVVLFPGYLIYHYALSAGWVAPVFGGLFGSASLAVAMFCLIASPWLLRPSYWGAEPATLVFLAGWIFLAIWIFAGTVSIAEQNYVGVALRESASMLVFWISMFFIGSFFPLNLRKNRLLLGIFCILMFGVLVHAILIHGSLLGPYIAFTPDTESVVATYQGAGRSILISGVVASAMMSRPGNRLGFLALTVVALVLMGSRTYLIAGVAVTFSALALAIYSGRGRIVSLLVLAIAVGLGIVFAQELFAANRAMELLDLGSSSSWRSRLALQEVALRVIDDNPVFGDFSYHLRDIGPGGYAHNVLSAWTNFGLPGFGLYRLLLVSFLVLSMQRVLVSSSDSPYWRIALGLNVAAILISFAEPVFSVVPPLAWGFTVNALRSERAVMVAIVNG